MWRKVIRRQSGTGIGVRAFAWSGCSHAKRCVKSTCNYCKTSHRPVADAELSSSFRVTHGGVTHI